MEWERIKLTDKEYEDLKSKNMIYFQPKLQVRYLPGAPLDLIGTYSYEYPKVGDTYIARKTHDRIYMRVNAVYLNEAFIRLSASYGHKNYAENTGTYWEYRVTHNLGEDEEYITMDCGSNLSAKIIHRLNRNAIHDRNVDQYIFHLHKTGVNPPGRWWFDVYYRDDKLPRIPPNKIYYSNEKLGIRTGNGKVMEPVTSQRRLWAKWTEDRMRSLVDFTKDYLIPMHPEKPTKKVYMEWFQQYGLDKALAEDCFRYRGQVRLP